MYLSHHANDFPRHTRNAPHANRPLPPCLAVRNPHWPNRSDNQADDLKYRVPSRLCVVMTGDLFVYAQSCLTPQVWYTTQACRAGLRFQPDTTGKTRTVQASRWHRVWEFLFPRTWPQPSPTCLAAPRPIGHQSLA